MAAATASVNGYLTSADWNTFNGKQAAGSYVTSGGALGTPSSGTLTNCTFPTLNQNTTGSSGSCTGNAATATIATTANNGAKAWVNFAGATGTVNQSFNVSSVTRTATGNYQINFTTAFSNANYSIIGMTDPSNAQRSTISCYSPSQANTASQAYVVTWNNSGGGYDCQSVSIAAFGA